MAKLRERAAWWWFASTMLVAAAACAPAEDDTDAVSSGTTGSGPGTTGPGATPDTSGSTPGAGGSTTPSGAAGGGSQPPAQGGAGSGAAGPPPEVLEMLDPTVDWEALTLVYPTMYSAYDGVHLFQVPVYVDGATIELSGWSSIPESAVTFEPEPEMGGVLVTIVEDVPEITIAARSDQIGGTATLHVTSATPEQWEMGEARYANGVEFNLPTITPETFAMLLLDPNYMFPEPPKNLACNNCHTTGAKYFEIQHTPTQVARFSDEDLSLILTMGQKPPGIGFRVLPEMLLNMTAEQIYGEYHRWEASDEEVLGLVVYLRSLTPTGQGDILLPDGSYAPPGMFPMFPMP